MPKVTLPVGRGSADGVDSSLIDAADGELQESEGVVYNPGDPAAHKIPGRTKFNSSELVSGNPIRSIKFAQYDDSASSANKLFALVTASGNATNTLYSATEDDTGAGVAIRTGLNSAGELIDMTKYVDNVIMCDGNSTPWIVRNDHTASFPTFRLGMDPVTTAPSTALITGAATHTAAFQYWITEYNPTDDVEGAYNGVVGTANPSSQDVVITYPATFVNSDNASDIDVVTTFRLYRSRDDGAFPVGWLVDSTTSTGSTFTDTITDPVLVTKAPYKTITINGATESRDREPKIFESITTHQGSLVGVVGRGVFWSAAAVVGSFPASYNIFFRPLFGGTAHCVRSLDEDILVLFDNETFRVNYLPRGNDSIFDGDVAQKRISTYGTPSPNGAVEFSGYGGRPLLFFASTSYPMLTDGNITSRAVGSIDWAEHVSLVNLGGCVAINNNDKYRVELYCPTDDTSVWRCLHFYYDEMRLGQGPLPKMTWTGPHIVPGPGTYAVLNGVGRVYTGNNNDESTIYFENGVVDNAQLVDTTGTVNFRLRTAKLYSAGIGNETTLDRIYVHKASTGSGDYTVTVTPYRDEEQAGVQPQTQAIPATTVGISSLSYNVSGTAHDIRVVRDDILAMPAINNITFEVKNLGESEKTST